MPRKFQRGSSNLHFNFGCADCGGPCRFAYRFCPWCGKEYEPYTNKNGRRYTIECFRKIVQPIVDLNGYVWVARKVGVDESSIRHVMKKQAFSISDRVAEKWIMALGIENAMYDGSLEIYKKSETPEPPPSQFYEE